jgi:hypothetical protein
MSGNGGHKHRENRLQQKRTQKKKAGRANVARVRKMFEAKGQTWDPAKNSVQAQALNHQGRRTALAKVHAS